MRLRDLLPSVVGRFGVQDADAIAVVWSRWAEMVGTEIARHAEPTSLRSGTLRIRVDSATWVSELAYLVEEIKNKVNRIAGRVVVHEVRVWTGPAARSHRGVRRRADTPAGGRGAPIDSAPPSDPATALARARVAWSRKRDQGSRRGPE
jgi:predicted nucleic acid-binding Zn ribbon protein